MGLPACPRSTDVPLLLSGLRLVLRKVMGPLGTAQSARTDSFHSRILPTGYKGRHDAHVTRQTRHRPGRGVAGRKYTGTTHHTHTHHSGPDSARVSRHSRLSTLTSVSSVVRKVYKVTISQMHLRSGSSRPTATHTVRLGVLETTVSSQPACF